MQSLLIIFPDEHLPYSPTILNLAKALRKHASVDILSFASRHFGRVDESYVKYLPIPFWEKKFYGLINKFSKSFGLTVLALLKRKAIRHYLKTHTYNQIIVTDPIALWMIKGLQVPRTHMVSLELTHNTTAYIHKVSLNNISSLIIQSKERKQVLAPDYNGPVFYLQNAPAYQPALEAKANPPENLFIFSGTAFSWFGIFQCLEYLKAYPGAKMTMIGKLPEAEREVIENKYSDLKETGRLMIPGKYYSDEEMLREISRHRIGFCFYDLSYSHINNINYLTAPSGKMFAYFAAGVPVIGINIPGLQPIEDFNAGVLIPEMGPDAIHAAVQKIEANYEAMVQGCFKAARHFDFETAVKPIVGFFIQDKK